MPEANVRRGSVSKPGNHGKARRFPIRENEGTGAQNREMEHFSPPKRIAF